MLNKKIVFIISIIFLLLGCTNKEIKLNKINVLQYQPETNTSLITTYNDELKKENTYKFNNILITGTKITNKKNELISMQYLDKSNSYQIISINKKTSQIKKISLKNESPSTYHYFNNKIYYSSNYINNNNLQIYDLNTKKTNTIKLDKLIINSFVSNKKYIYIFLSNINENKHYLYQMNKDNKVIKTYQLPKAIINNSNVLLDNNNVYFFTTDDLKTISNNYFNIIDTSLLKLNTYPYPYDYPANIIINNNNAYISNADTYNFSDSDKVITKFNLQTKQYTNIKVKENIYNMKKDKNYLYMISNNNIYRFNLKTNTFDKENKLNQNYFSNTILIH